MTADQFFLWKTALASLFFLDFLYYLPFCLMIFGKAYNPTTRRGSSVIILMMTLWLVSICSVAFDYLPVWGSLVLLIIFRRLFIKERWNSLFRGGGAPGFMSHHQVLYLFFFEVLLNFFAPSTNLTQTLFQAYRLDLGLILLCSGIYKASSGYLQGEGMEYGCVNPMWSYFFRFFRKLSWRNPFYQIQNYAAVFSQIIAGACLVLSPFLGLWAQYLGALLCAGMFFYLIFVIRLGRLAPLMMVAALPLFPPFSHLPLASQPLGTFSYGPVVDAVKGLIWAYMAVLIIIKAVQYLNFYGNKNLPEPFQALVVRIFNFIPVIIWRVFTPDVTNFFVRAWAVNQKTGERRRLVHEDDAYSYRNTDGFLQMNRLLGVTESISLTTIFTTLRYFKTNRALFEERLLTYTKTLGFRDDEEGLYEFVSLVKGEKYIEPISISEFRVDLTKREVLENALTQNLSVQDTARLSRVRESVGFGRYEVKKS